MSREHVVICKQCTHIFRSPSELPKFKECPKCGSGNVTLAASPTGHPVMVRVDFAEVIGYGVGAAAGGALDGLDGFMILFAHKHPDRTHPHPEQTIFMSEAEAKKLRDALNTYYPPQEFE